MDFDRAKTSVNNYEEIPEGIWEIAFGYIDSFTSKEYLLRIVVFGLIVNVFAWSSLYFQGESISYYYSYIEWSDRVTRWTFFVVFFPTFVAVHSLVKLVYRVEQYDDQPAGVLEGYSYLHFRQRVRIQLMISGFISAINGLLFTVVVGTGVEP